MITGVIVFSDRGSDVRGAVVKYDRSNEAAAMLTQENVNWSKVFSGGVRVFHSGGIYAALSKNTTELIISGMKAAKINPVDKIKNNEDPKKKESLE